MEYKRFTKKGSYYAEDDHELDLVIELDEHHYEEVNDIDTLCKKLNRLVELEDKIENGTLIELGYHIRKSYRNHDDQRYKITYVSERDVCRIDCDCLTKSQAEEKLKELQDVK